MKYDYELIGKKIISRRKEKGMTQSELGQKVGVTSQAVSRWEKGVSIPDISVLAQLSNVLDISFQELIGLDVKEKKEKNFWHRFVFLSLVFIIIILVSFLCFTLFTEKTKTATYRAYSSNNDYHVDGILSLTPSKNSMMLGNFIYTDNDVISFYEIEYTVFINDKFFLKSGDVESFNAEEEHDLTYFADYLKKLTIYFDHIDSSFFEEKEEFYVSIKFRYITPDIRMYDEYLLITFEE